MSRLLGLLLWAMLSGEVLADWSRVGGTKELTTYVDTGSLSKVENIVRMWGLVDMKEAKKEETGKSFLSAKGLQEYDCQKEQIRKITLSFLSENMGAGEVVHTYTDPEHWKWNPVTQGTLSEAMWKVACEKK